jgi:excisionase family DNA binding protein
MTTLITVTQAAAFSGFNRAYIGAEIRAGRLVATKVGNQYVIEQAAFTAWMSKPRRGSRSK